MHPRTQPGSLPVSASYMNMADYCIRLYKDSDYDTVRDLFAKGSMECTPVAFYHTFSLPRFWLFMLVVFLIPLLTIGSITLSILTVTLTLVRIWFCTRDIMLSYIQHSLSNDMLDIHKYYLQRDGYCYWVAESAGEVVGMVAAEPSSNTAGEKHVVLRRLSVAKSHRGKGIGKVLCRTVIDFARERGCSAVILETTSAQIDAQRLYEKMGFRCFRTFYASELTAKLIEFIIMLYQYDIPTGSENLYPKPLPVCRTEALLL
ncbi:putative N-acetyltransferase camello isoform X1 [Ascaphus truei]|uniref:putative N-acetyltransferase camello isoform X1 n=2 Tax=Ascaphus truei TaxID=8439 RepID=UPI003F5A3180